jgi:uncharacterized cupin superfamily protein
MTVRKVNVRCDLNASLSEGGFQHAAASIADRLGARRIGAGVHEAVAERPIWPYHYHYSSEEWLYVISGRPVLRDAAGRRALKSGDLLCFPPDHRGAHTVFGPGRFIILSTNESSGPWVSVYPDSDKISNRHGEVVRALIISTTGFPANAYYPDSGTWSCATTHTLQLSRCPGTT